MVAFSPTYLPRHRRGAEISLHAVLRWFAARGHDVRVVVDDAGRWSLDDVAIVGAVPRRDALQLCRDADVVLGQLDGRWRALSLAARCRRPAAYFVHIGNVDRRSLYGAPDLTVFNSHTLARGAPWVRNAIVVHPPIDEHDYLTTAGSSVTLVNLSEAKGADLFFSLAARLPDVPFLGVKTSPTQVVRRPAPPNVTIMEPVADMREVYCRTRTLLLPSAYESYGRVALEAAVSGIPTIAHPNPGTIEAMDDAALWADRFDEDGWVQHLGSLDHPATYRERSERARARYEVTASNGELEQLEQALQALQAR
jgi:hypothetical protein